jgi:hypothetical protein
MLFIITPNVNNNDETLYLAKTAQAIGYEVISPAGWKLPESILNRPGMVYGEKLFCEVIANQMNWSLEHNSPDWITSLPKHFVNREIYYTTLAEARKEKAKKYFKLTDMKHFPAGVRNFGRELPSNELFNSDGMLVSDEMKFTSEYKCVIKDNKAITACCYSKLQEFNLKVNYGFNHDLIIKFINCLLKDKSIQCVSGSVINVGKYDKDKFAIIDSEPPYSSKIYGCEPIAMLAAIKASVANDAV